jgi:hypothetical protein
MARHYLSVDMLHLRTNGQILIQFAIGELHEKWPSNCDNFDDIIYMKTYFCFCVYEHFVHKISTCIIKLGKKTINFSYKLKIKREKYNPVLKSVCVFIAS